MDLISPLSIDVCLCSHLTSRYLSRLPIFVDILVWTTWLMRMFLLLIPHDLMIKYSHMLYGYPLERETMAFTTSASVPTIYIQPFWNTLTYVEKARTYRFQLDESWFTLDANLLKDALEITPIDPAHKFVSPPLGEAIMDFVNQLGYTK
ncbi:hypothetical protein Tco_0175857, partial [Tanacetum coccineum]